MVAIQIRTSYTKLQIFYNDILEQFSSTEYYNGVRHLLKEHIDYAYLESRTMTDEH